MTDTVADFWRMMWETKSAAIVMLTELMEDDQVGVVRVLPPSVWPEGVVMMILLCVGDVCEVLAQWCWGPQCVWTVSGGAE